MIAPWVYAIEQRFAVWSQLMSERKISRTRGLADKVVFAALQALKDNEGELSSKQTHDEVQNRVDFNP